MNLVNSEALTRFGPIYVDTVQRTADETWKDAEYVAGLIEARVEALGGTSRVVG